MSMTVLKRARFWWQSCETKGAKQSKSTISITTTIVLKFKKEDTASVYMYVYTSNTVT